MARLKVLFGIPNPKSIRSLLVNATGQEDNPKYKIKILYDFWKMDFALEKCWLAVISFLRFFLNTVGFCFLKAVGYVTMDEDPKSSQSLMIFQTRIRACVHFPVWIF